MAAKKKAKKKTRKADVFAKDKKSTAGKVKARRQTQQERLDEIRKEAGW